MSTTMQLRSWEQARAEAEEFRGLFPECYERWQIAGSVRRRSPECGDVEHVVIPRVRFVEVHDPAEQLDLFAAAQPEHTAPPRMPVSMLWERLEELELAGVVRRHLYGAAQTPRWGQRYRGVEYRGALHEIFTAERDNFGAILCIRTGPREFGIELMRRLAARGYQQRDGWLWKLGGEVKQPERVPDEETYLARAGLAWIAPEARR